MATRHKPLFAAVGIVPFFAMGAAHALDYNDTGIADDDGTSNVGLHASIAIGSDHTPTIGCRDGFTGSLNVAHCRSRSRDGLFRVDFE